MKPRWIAAGAGAMLATGAIIGIATYLGGRGIPHAPIDQTLEGSSTSGPPEQGASLDLARNRLLYNPTPISLQEFDQRLSKEQQAEIRAAIAGVVVGDDRAAESLANTLPSWDVGLDTVLDIAVLFYYVGSQQTAKRFFGESISRAAVALARSDDPELVSAHLDFLQRTRYPLWKMHAWPEILAETALELRHRSAFDLDRFDAALFHVEAMYYCQEHRKALDLCGKLARDFDTDKYSGVPQSKREELDWIGGYIAIGVADFETAAPLLRAVARRETGLFRVEAALLYAEIQRHLEGDDAYWLAISDISERLDIPNEDRLRIEQSFKAGDFASVLSLSQP